MQKNSSNRNIITERIRDVSVGKHTFKDMIPFEFLRGCLSFAREAFRKMFLCVQISLHGLQGRGNRVKDLIGTNSVACTQVLVVWPANFVDGRSFDLILPK